MHAYPHTCAVTVRSSHEPESSERCSCEMVAAIRGLRAAAARARRSEGSEGGISRAGRGRVTGCLPTGFHAKLPAICRWAGFGVAQKMSRQRFARGDRL